MAQESGSKTRLFKPMVLLSAIGAVAILSTTMSKSPVLPFFAEFLGATPEQMGFIAAASTIPGILVSLPVGILADRKGPHCMLWISILLVAFVPFLYLLIITPQQLFLVRFLHGFATAILGPIALAIVASWYSTRRGERMASYSSSTRVGRMLAPLVGGLLFSVPIFVILDPNLYHGVYLACGLFGIVAFGLMLVLSITAKDTLGFEQSPEERMNLSMLRQVTTVQVLLICSAQAAVFFLYGAFEFFMPLYWTTNAGIADWMTGPLLSLFTATFVLSSPALGALSDRYGRQGFIIGGLFTMCISTILLVLLPYSLIQIGLIIPMALTMAAVVSATIPFITEVVNHKLKGTALGLLSTIMDIGQVLGPITVGFLLAASGSNYLYAFAIASCNLLLIPLLLLLYRIHTKPTKAHQNE
ncbi:MAG: MFS transporter [Promethearchaeota archaeon]